MASIIGQEELIAQYQKQWVARMQKSIDTIIALRQDRDKQLYGLLADVPVPPELVSAIVYFEKKVRNFRNPRLKDLVRDTFLTPARLYLQVFEKNLIIVESLLKEEATERSEREVLAPP